MIENVLNPMDELIAAAFRFPFLGGRRGSGKDQNRHAALGRVVDRPAHRLRSAFNVHDHGLRFPGNLGKAVRGRKRDHLVGTGDDLGKTAAAFGLRRNRLDEGGVVAAEIGKDVLDPGFAQGIEQGSTGRRHGRPGGMAGVGQPF